MVRIPRHKQACASCKMGAMSYIKHSGAALVLLPDMLLRIETA